MPVVCGGNENAKWSVQFRMVKQEMWDECLFGPVRDFGDNIFPCFSVLPHWGTSDSSPVGGVAEGVGIACADQLTCVALW